LFSGGGKVNYVWLNNLIDIKSGVGVGLGRWFDNNVGREDDDKIETLFWWDMWIDGMILKSSFNHLFFILLIIKWQRRLICTLLWWGEGGEGWKRRHRLFAWEEDQVREYCAILSNIVLQPNNHDRWLWHSHAYNCMLSSVNIVAADHSNAIWNNDVPLKFNLFA
jgi:hypothetical protein